MIVFEPIHTGRFSEESAFFCATNWGEGASLEKSKILDTIHRRKSTVNKVKICNSENE